MDHNVKTEARELIKQALPQFVLLLLMAALFLQSAQAEEGGGQSEPKMISGMSVIGSDEAPKSLFIVPWKSSEIGFETNLDSGMMDDSVRPVDKDVFMRQIDFYEIRHAK